MKCRGTWRAGKTNISKGNSSEIFTIVKVFVLKCTNIALKRSKIDGTPIMIIGHHILYGKVIDLEKPLVAMEKMEVGKELDQEEMMDMDEHLEMKTEFRVKSIIKKKLIFKTRPKPIIVMS